MDWINNYLSIPIITTLSVVVVVQLFISYFKEKGKNLATKEDIKDITTQIEGVKSDFQVLAHTKTNVNTEKRNSILNFYDKYFTWYHTLTTSLYSDIDPLDVIEINKNVSKMNLYLNEVKVAEAKVLLWNSKCAYSENLLALVNKTNELHKERLLLCYSQKQVIHTSNTLKTVEEHNKIGEQILINMRNYKKDTDGIIKELNSKIEKFVEESYEYLLSI